MGATHMFWKKSKPARRRVFRPTLDGLENRELMTVVPAGYTATEIAKGLSKPSSIAVAPDGRLFVAQQTGEIRIIQNGKLLPAPFLKINVDSNNERGLVG